MIGIIVAIVLTFALSAGTISVASEWKFSGRRKT